jgi:hypothetical protein
MDAGDLIRLAWEAEHDGRSRLRDALLTLAIAESSPGDAWVERCRARLIAERPDHYFGHFATITQALEDPRVVEARGRLRDKYPASRVKSLLLRARAGRGPYLGRVESLAAMIADLAGPVSESEPESENVRRHTAQESRGPIHRRRAGRPLAFALSQASIASGLEAPSVHSPRRIFPVGEATVSEPPLEDFPVYYLSVLLAIAFVLAAVQQSAEVPTL